MSNQEVKTTTLGSIGTSVLVLVLLIIVVVVVIYIVQSSIVPSFPVSPFNYEDTVVIRPAILTANPNINPNQYLTPSQIYRNNNCLSPQCTCTPRYDYGSASSIPLGYALTLTGDKNDQRSQWVLKQFSSPGNFDASQSLVYGLGNRFYLHNKANPNPLDPRARARFQQLNQGSEGFCYSTTPIVMGADGGDQQCNWFNMEWLVYFLPTNFPDLYYILFPTCSDETNLQTQPNTGIASVRPWAPNVTNNEKSILQIPDCAQCSNIGSATFNPFINGNPTPGLFNHNVIIANLLDPNNILPPYPNANVLLFHITKLS